MVGDPPGGLGLEVAGEDVALTDVDVVVAGEAAEDVFGKQGLLGIDEVGKIHGLRPGGGSEGRNAKTKMIR